ncbi:hypothetical protein, partial [Fervidicella metallireducens]|uniref:hypothetical protein n=1 Tax=Fervidicella metallireducens TaxID=655338 RepID=UPI0005580979
FLSEDSYRGDRKDPLSLNLYTYCHNEPIMYVDPDGHREAVGAVYADEKMAKKNETKKNMYTKHKPPKTSSIKSNKRVATTKHERSKGYLVEHERSVAARERAKANEVNKKKATNEVDTKKSNQQTKNSKKENINTKDKSKDKTGVRTQIPYYNERSRSVPSIVKPHDMTPEARAVLAKERAKIGHVAKEAGLGTVQAVGGAFEISFGVTIGTASQATPITPITAIPGAVVGTYVAVDGVSNFTGGVSRIKNAVTGSNAGDEWNFMKEAYKIADPVNGERNYNISQGVIGAASLTTGVVTTVTSVKLAGVESSNLIKYTGKGMTSLSVMTVSNTIDAYSVDSSNKSLSKNNKKGGKKNGSK